MSKVDEIEVSGTVIDPLPNAMLRWSWKTDTLFWRMFPGKSG